MALGENNETETTTRKVLEWTAIPLTVTHSVEYVDEATAAFLAQIDPRQIDGVIPEEENA